MIINIIPVDDLLPHTEMSTCKCGPVIIMESDQIIIRHNSYDERELIEELLIGSCVSVIDKKQWNVITQSDRTA